MNKVYKTVWNEQTGTYVAVSELTKGRGKRNGSSRSLAVASAVLSGAALFGLNGVASAITFNTDDGTSQDIAIGETVIISGDGDNINTSANASEITISLNKDITVDSVTTGNSTLNTNGLEITNGPSVTTAGIDAGSKKITNLAAGAASGDAVNFGQLEAVKNTASAGWDVSDGTNTNNIGSAGKVTFSGDSNIKVTESGANDDALIKVELERDLDVDSLTAGNSKLGATGLVVTGGPSVTTTGINAGNKKITNVGDGSIAAGSKEAVTGGQIYDLQQDLYVDGDGVKYFHANSTLADSVADGTDSVAIGPESEAKSDDSFAAGHGAVVGEDSDSGIALGTNSKIGENSSKSIAIGDAANVGNNATGAIALGEQANVAATGVNGVAIGAKSSATEENAVAIGNSTSAADNSVGIGSTSTASGLSSIGIGNNAESTAENGIALGTGARVATHDSIALGTNAGVGTVYNTPQDNIRHSHIAIGKDAGQNVAGNETIAIGVGAGSNVKNSYNVAIGSQAGSYINGERNVALGHKANENSVEENIDDSVAIGGSSQAMSDAIAVGHGAKATSKESIAIGSGSVAQDGSIALGHNSFAEKVTGSSYLTGEDFTGESVSVGNSTTGLTRRITNVEDGSGGYDAVNVRQLEELKNSLGSFTPGSGGNVNYNTDGTISVDAGTADNSAVNLAQMNAAINAKKPRFFSVNPNGDGANEDGTGALGTDSANSMAIGHAAKVEDSKNATSVGYGVLVKGDDGTAIGSESAVDDVAGVSIGRKAYSRGENSLAMGTDAQTGEENSGITIENAIAFGTSSRATNDDATALGHKATATGSKSTAVGYYSEASGTSASAIGTQANASGENSFASGTESAASGLNAFASGTNALAAGQDSFAQGTGAKANTQNAIAIGINSDSGYVGDNSSNPQIPATTNTIAIGKNSTVKGQNSLAVGSDNKVGSTSGKVNGNDSGAFGNSNQIYQDNSFAVGNTNFINQKNTFVLGSGVTTSQANSVVLGNESTDREAIKRTGMTVDKIDYTFAGQGDPAYGVVSVGAKDAERQIINVAAGEVSETSTDAINGSQLYGTNMAVNALADDLDTAGKSVADALGGTSSYDPDSHTVAAGLSVNGNKYTNVQDALGYVGQGWKVQTNGDTADSVLPGETVQFINGQNIAVTRNGKDITIATVDTPSFKGADMGDEKITGVAAGTDDTDAVNVSQLNDVNTTANKGWNISADGDTATKVAPGDSVDFGNTDDNIKITRSSNGLTFNLADDVEVNNSITVGGGTNQTSITGGDITTNNLNVSGETKLGSNFLVDNSGKVTYNSYEVATQNDGLSFAGNTGTDISKTLADTEPLTISGELAAGENSTGKNLRVDSDGSKLNLVMARDLTDLDSITINNGGPIINSGGIDMNSKKITNLADGTVDSDAVNLGQLKDVANTASAGWNYTGTNSDGFSTMVNNVAPGDTVDFSNTDGNIRISKSADGLAFNLNKDLNLTDDGSVKTGNSLMNNDGLTVEDGDNKTTTTALGTTMTDGLGNTTTTTASGMTVDNGAGSSTTVEAGTIGVTDTNGTTNIAGNQISVGGGHTITISGDTGTINGLTNKTFDPDNFTSGQAATEDQLKSVSDTANMGWNYTGTNSDGFSTMVNNVAPGDTVDFSNTDGNIKISKSTDGLAFNLNKDINLGPDGSLKTGDTLVNNDGLEIDDGAGNITATTAMGTTVTEGTNVTTLNSAGLNVTDGANSSYIGAGYAIFGPVSINGGSVAGTINGLSNKTFNPANFTSGQAATEDQLGAMGNVLNIGMDGSGNNYISYNGIQYGDLAAVLDSIHWDVDVSGSGSSGSGSGGSGSGGSGSGGSGSAGNSGGGNATGSGETGIHNGNKVTFVAGDNINLDKTPTGGKGDTEIAVSLAQDIVLNSVTAKKVQADQVVTNEVIIQDGPTINKNGINMNDKPITNLAPGVNGTDAVNVNQLNQLANNVSGELNRMDNKINRNDHKASAGIAAAIATAGLPQAYLPGKSMFSMAGGTWRGESGYAMGLSTVSDNGKWVLKGTASGSSRGDYGGSVGVGYQW